MFSPEKNQAEKGSDFHAQTSSKPEKPESGPFRAHPRKVMCLLLAATPSITTSKPAS